MHSRGCLTEATSLCATAIGFVTKAYGSSSFAAGDQTKALASNSVALGNNTTAYSYAETVIGSNSSDYTPTFPSGWDLTDRLFVIGNGTGTGAKSNAFMVLKNGNTCIDPSNKNNGVLSGNALLFGTYNSGEGIATKKNAGSNQFGLDFFTASNSRMTITSSGNVGIGTNAPLAHLHVQNNSVLFSAACDIPVSKDPPPLEGSGRRMMWYADKAAFRAGFAGTQWDNANIGNYSAALGYGTAASGLYSTALGNGTVASGAASLSTGKFTIASGNHATAMGEQNEASGAFSTAWGYQTTASNSGSTSFGYSTNAFGAYATAMGYGSSASTYGLAMGYQSNAYGSASAALGNNSNAYSFGETAIGVNNTSYTPAGVETWNGNDRLFVIGNGADAGQRSDAIVVLKNGNTGIGNSIPNAPLASKNTTGTKISLYEGNPNSQYGFAVQPSQLQMYTDAVQAKISFGYYTSGVFTERMNLNNSTGILNVSGVNYASDERYKKQITEIENSLEKIEAIRGVEYYMRRDEFPSKNFDDKLQVGLLAQEVEKILPQAVQTGDDGYKAIDYARVVPLLVEGIKEQQKQINELKLLVEKLIK